MEFVEGLSLPDYMKKIHMPRLLLKDAFALLKPMIVSLEKYTRREWFTGKSIHHWFV